MQAFRHYTNYAYNLLTLKYYEEAANTYEEAVTFVKENFQKDAHAQLNQLRTMYDLDKLEIQAEKDKLQLSATRNKLIAFIIATVLLSVIVLIVNNNMRRIRKKNIGLVQRIREQDLLEEELFRQREELDRLRTCLLYTSPSPRDRG